MSRVRPWFLLAHVYRLGFENSPQVSIDPRFNLHPPSRAELADAYADLQNQLDPDKVDAAILRGDVCVAAFDSANGKKMVGFAWGATRTAPHGDGVWVAVDFPNVYGYKAYVTPEYRGQRLNLALIVERDKILASDGYTASVGFVETHNYASVSSNIRLGSEAMGYAGYVKLFGRTLPFRTPRAKQSSLRFYRETNPK